MTDAVDLDPVTGAWVTYIRQQQAIRDEAAANIKRAAEVIQAKMGAASEARIGGKPVVTWRTSAPSTYIDGKALAAAHPAIAAEFTRVKAASRPFKILDEA